MKIFHCLLKHERASKVKCKACRCASWVPSLLSGGKAQWFFFQDVMWISMSRPSDHGPRHQHLISAMQNCVSFRSLMCVILWNRRFPDVNFTAGSSVTQFYHVSLDIWHHRSTQIDKTNVSKQSMLWLKDRKIDGPNLKQSQVSSPSDIPHDACSSFNSNI